MPGWTCNAAYWLAVALIIAAAGFWAFWGAIEAFHEGWRRPTLIGRLLQTAAYLSPAAVLTSLGYVGARWPQVGGVLMTLAGAAVGGLIVADGANFGWQVVAMLVGVPIAVGGFAALRTDGSEPNRPAPRAAPVGGSDCLRRRTRVAGGRPL
ncbi:MAG: hypothetical protein AAGJ46_10235 [Planctomycetota bacterium]